MGVQAELECDRVLVVPGGVASNDIRLRNLGRIIDEFTFLVIGDAAAWVSVEPPSLSLFPTGMSAHQAGWDATASIVFRPPAATAAGEIEFDIRVNSKEDPSGFSFLSGTVAVEPVPSVSAELKPRTSRGSRTARHRVVFDNFSNFPVAASLAGDDPDDALDFAFDPPVLDADPGTARFASVVVRARESFLIGAVRNRPFEVRISPEGAPPVRLHATMVQQPFVPRWVAVSSVLVTLLLVGLLAAWLSLLRPEVQSAARDAVAAPIADQAEAINILAANQGLAALVDVPARPDEKPAQDDRQAPSGGETPSPVVPLPLALSPAQPPAVAVEPFDARLVVNGERVTERTLGVPDGAMLLSVTDIVLQNPGGDLGSMELLRGDAVIMKQSLADFRDLDFHFLSPIVFREGQSVAVRVDCQNPPGKPCTAAAFVGGFTTPKPT